MKAEELARERARRPVGEVAQRLGAEKALSEIDQRIENQRKEDTSSKRQARLEAAGSRTTSPVKPGARSVSVTPESSPSSGSPTRLSPSGRSELTQMEQDIASKASVRVVQSVVTAPGVYQNTTNKDPSGPSELSQMEKDIASKASARPTQIKSSLAMAPGAYQVATSEPGVDSASASGAPEKSDTAIKARGRNRGAISTPSTLSQAEADVAAKTRRTPAPGAPGVPSSLSALEADAEAKSRGRTRAAVTPGARQVNSAAAQARDPEVGAGPGAPSSLTALEADMEAKNRGKTRAADTPEARQITSAAAQARAPDLAVSEVSHVGSEPIAVLTSSTTSTPGAVAMTPVEIMSLEERITYKTGISLDNSELGQETLLNKVDESFRLGKDSKRGSKEGTVQDDLDVLENSSKDITAPHVYSGRGRSSEGINGAGHAFDDQEHLAVAVAIEEEDDEKYLVSAVEYDPDAKPTIFKNRRFRMYNGLIAIVLLGLILGVVLGLVLGGDDKTTFVDGEEEEDPTSAPTTFRESLGIEGEIEIGVGSSKLFDPSTSQHGALQWILNEDPSALEAGDPSLMQRFLLVQFYLETSQQGPWNSCGRAEEGEEPTFCLYKEHNLVTQDTRLIPSSRWLSEQDECLWSGVQCDDLNQVTLIDLSNQNMTGTLPTELALLPFLQRIDFPRNRFTGTLPREWGEMNHLIHVAVHYNSLEGTIPDTWWDLGATMTGLNLGYNRLNGTIPGDRLGGMYNLRSLFIDNNHFIGAIPTEVGMLTDLRNTRWNGNFFSGTLPTEFGQLKKLREFWFQRLLLTGTIPSEIADMPSLSDFRVQNTGLEGIIPDRLYQLSKLQRVDLFSTNIGGTISTEIGNMFKLKTFRIKDCQFFGTIPTEMGLLSNLQEVWLEGNNFNGEIPSEVCDLRGRNDLQVLVADCANTESTGFPAVTCKSGCCTSCCDTESSICDQ